MNFCEYLIQQPNIFGSYLAKDKIGNYINNIKSQIDLIEGVSRIYLAHFYSLPSSSQYKTSGNITLYKKTLNFVNNLKTEKKYGSPIYLLSQKNLDPHIDIINKFQENLAGTYQQVKFLSNNSKDLLSLFRKIINFTQIFSDAIILKRSEYVFLNIFGYTDYKVYTYFNFLNNFQMNLRLELQKDAYKNLNLSEKSIIFFTVLNDTLGNLEDYQEFKSQFIIDIDNYFNELDLLISYVEEFSDILNRCIYLHVNISNMLNLENEKDIQIFLNKAKTGVTNDENKKLYLNSFGTQVAYNLRDNLENDKSNFELIQNKALDITLEKAGVNAEVITLLNKMDLFECYYCNTNDLEDQLNSEGCS